MNPLRFKIEEGDEPFIYQIDGGFEFFIHEKEVGMVINNLNKHYVNYKNHGPAIFSAHLGDDIMFTSGAKKEDIVFALEDCIKSLRPRP